MVDQRDSRARSPREIRKGVGSFNSFFHPARLVYVVAAFFFEKETRDKCFSFSVSKSKVLQFSRTPEAGEVSWF